MSGGSERRRPGRTRTPSGESSRATTSARQSADLRGGPFVPEPVRSGSRPAHRRSGRAAWRSPSATTPRTRRLPVRAVLRRRRRPSATEVDFQGDLVSDLDALGFHDVRRTGENNTRGTPSTCRRSRSRSLPRTMIAARRAISHRLVYVPANSTANEWSGYIDAAADGGELASSPAQPARSTSCNQTTYCDLDRESRLRWPKVAVRTRRPRRSTRSPCTKGRDNCIRWVRSMG